MPSRRLPSSLEPNALTLALAERRAQGLPVLDLTVSNPFRCALPYPEAALREALAPGPLGYDPDPRGAQAARAAVAAHHRLDPAQVQLTASTSEAYAWLFKLLCDPGDDVLVPSPSYPLFHWLGSLEGVEARPVPALLHERWHLDLEALAAAAGPRTRAVVLVNPNNPTGHFLNQAEGAALAAFCAGRGLALLVDEVFADYALEPPADRLATALDLPDPACPVFVLSGLSKIAALPQVKLGWILAHGAPARALLEPLGFIADQYLSVSAAAQQAAPALLALAPGIQAGLRARLRANLAHLDAALAAWPWLSRLPVEGGWSVLLRRPALDSAEACALRALALGAWVHPGHFFDIPGEGHLVLSLLTAEDTFRQGLPRVAEATRP